MVRIIILSFFLTLVACKGVQQIQEQAKVLEDMKTEISELQSSVEFLEEKIDSLEAKYTTHLDEYHGGGTESTTPAPKPRPKPRPKKVK